MKHWISAFRLRTLPLSFSNVLLGSALVYDLSLGFFDFRFSWKIFGLTLLTTLLLQILSNLANDYGDSQKGADNEGRIGPARTIQSGRITKTAMLRAIILFSVLSFGSGIWLIITALGSELNWIFITFILLGLASIAAAIKYTVGKGAYGYAGLGDVFVFIFFGIVGVCGTTYLQILDFHWLFLLPAISMGCFSVAVLNLNNMRDRENDMATGKKTLVTRLGFKRAKVYHYILLSVGYASFPMLLLSTLFREGERLTAIPSIILLIILVLHVKKVYLIKDPKDFDPELKKVALSAFLFSLLLFAVIGINQ